MSTSKFPTLQQVIPFFNVLSHELDRFIECECDEMPDYYFLETEKGRAREICEAVYEARLKLLKYYKKSKLSPLCIAVTGCFIFVIYILRDTILKIIISSRS